MKAESNIQTTKVESTELEQSSFGLSAFSPRLKIGYDGKRAANNLTGLGNYSRSLIEQLAKQFPENDYLVYTPKIKSSKQIDAFFETEKVKLIQPVNSALLWRSLNILKDLLRDGVQIYHGLSHEIPFAIHHTKIKSVVTIHDLIFLRYPEYYKFIDRKLYAFKARYACKNANRIIAISEKTKSDIVEFFNVDADKIDVVYQSCDDSFKSAFHPTRLNEIRKKYQLPEQFILNVGTIEPRKNLKLLIQALSKVPATHKLIAIGRQTTYFKEVEQEIIKLGLQDRVVFLKDIPFGDLPGIYQLASIFVYPSFYEGFGIPIIEALYSCVPVVAATGSCLEEAGGPDSLYVSPTDSDVLAQAINKILSSEELKLRMQKKGYEFVQKFNSPLINQQLMDIYQQL
ncbi:glycosyltransferase family 4 protein [Pedobacter sp. AW1-32]|uniref:glycosyltransferase family 4 protein n=1 Tax=Pedobacter sp. AW1-32 TaxID=3383026 RepID=UPI003FF0FE7D